MAKRKSRLLPPEATYWKTTAYPADNSDDDLRDILKEKYNYSAGQDVKRGRLLYLLSRLERGLSVYQDLDMPQLEAECTRRSIPYTRATRGLITKLEAADESATFAPFMRLTPELRVWIYEFNTSWNMRSPAFRNGRVFLAVPPICQVSSLVRRESLPIFYDRFNPELRVVPPSAASGRWLSPCSANIPRMRTYPHLFAHLRRVTISLYITEYQVDETTLSGKYQYEFQFLPNKRIRVTYKGAEKGTLKAEWDEEKVKTLDYWIGDRLPRLMDSRAGLRLDSADADTAMTLARGTLDGRLVLNKCDGKVFD